MEADSFPVEMTEVEVRLGSFDPEDVVLARMDQLLSYARDLGFFPPEEFLALGEVESSPWRNRSAG